MSDLRSAPSALRNRDYIADVLEEYLPRRGTVLEIASGTGEHVVHFAQRFSRIEWQPSDKDDVGFENLQGWISACGVENVRSPIIVDATAQTWPLDCADLIVCINMIHISPPAASEGLFFHAGKLLDSGQHLVTYGPYRIDGKQTSPSNAKFELWLKGLNEAYGVRDIAELEAIAQKQGIRLSERIPMPANNFSLVWTRT